jgi:uncharacterized protein involved in exopolysaccharide biosynthesis
MGLPWRRAKKVETAAAPSTETVISRTEPEREAAPAPATGRRNDAGGRALPRAATSSAAPSAHAHDDYDLRAIWRHLARKKFWILVPTLGVAVLALVAVNMMSPRYKSEARIIVDGRENIFLRPNAERSEDRGSLDQEAVTSQVQLILSRDLARNVIAKNRLGELPEFDPLINGVSPLKSVLAMIGIGRDPLRLTPEERIFSAYYDRLIAYAVDKSRVIAIEFQSGDPEVAARVVNSIADGYLVLQQAARQEQARSASQWLSTEIDSLRKKVADAESRAEEFRTKSDLFIGTNNTSLSNQQLGEINTQLTTARAAKSDAESRVRSIREMLQSGRPIETSAVNSDIIRRLGEQRAAAKAQLAEQSSTLLDGHPRIKELRAQIADIDRQLRDEVARIARSLENDARIEGARVENLSASLEKFKRQASSTNSSEVELRALEREAKSQRELLESYLTRYREATARETIASAPADARIISRAIVSNSPAFPKKLPIVLIATLLTLLATSGYFASTELLRMTSAPAMPPNAGAKRLASAPADQSPLGDIEALAGELKAAEGGQRKITVVGATRKMDTSPAALTLARVMARESRVVLIGLAARSQLVAAASEDPAAPGLTELDQGLASFAQIITRDRFGGLHLIHAGHAGDPVQAGQSRRLAMTVNALARVYDHVIIDAGAIADLPLTLVTPDAQAVVVADAGLPQAARDEMGGDLMLAGFGRVMFLAADAASASASAKRRMEAA